MTQMKPSAHQEQKNMLLGEENIGITTVRIRLSTEVTILMRSNCYMFLFHLQWKGNLLPIEYFFSKAMLQKRPQMDVI